MATVFKRGGRKSKGEYLFAYTNHRGVRQTRSARTTDLEAARRIAAKFEADAALRVDGVVDPRLETLGEQSRRTIEEHLADFKAKLSAAGASVDHLTRTCRFIRDAAEAGGCEAAGDITADKVNHYGAELLKKNGGTQCRGTADGHQELHPLAGSGRRAPADPLASVEKSGAKTDRRMVRRMLLPDEWQWLRSVTLADHATRDGMPAGERVLFLCYRNPNGASGERGASLTRGSLFFDAAQPYITCKAGSTENRQAPGSISTPNWLPSFAARRHEGTGGGGVRHAAAGSCGGHAGPTGVVEGRKTRSRGTSETGAKRLPDARQPQKEALDFHSLRHTCGAWLAQSSATPQGGPSRHAAFRHHTDDGHLRPPVPRPRGGHGGPLAQPIEQRAAQGDAGDGNLGSKPQPAADREAQYTGAEGGNRRHTAKRGEPAQHGRDQEGDKSTFANLLPVPTLGKRRQEAAKAGNSGRDGTRTHTPANGDGILNPERLPFRHSA